MINASEFKITVHKKIEAVKESPPFKIIMALWTTILSIIALLKNSETVLEKLDKIDALQEPMKNHGAKIRELDEKVASLELKRVSDKQNGGYSTASQSYKSTDSAPSGSPKSNRNSDYGKNGKKSNGTKWNGRYRGKNSDSRPSSSNQE